MLKKFLIVFLSCLTIAYARSTEPSIYSKLKLDELKKELKIPPDQWLNAHQRRWEMKEIPDDQRHVVLDWARKQGLFDEVRPQKCVYDTALICGAAMIQMQSRLSYLTQLWNEGVRFQEVVWLTGDRMLYSNEPGYKNIGKTERDAAIYIWNTADLPEEMKQLPVVFINTKFDHEGTMATIAAWRDQTVFPKKCLFISSQPFVGYHETVLSRVLPETADVEVVGKKWDPSSHKAPATVILDCLARWMDKQPQKECMENQEEKYLYKILSKENWAASQKKASLVLSSDDDEFIHFSKDDQLERICSKYWGHVPEYYILKIDVKKLKGRLVFEANPGGVAKYYHLYDGTVPLDAVIEVNLHKKSISTTL